MQMAWKWYLKSYIDKTLIEHNDNPVKIDGKIINLADKTGKCQKKKIQQKNADRRERN